MNELSDEQPNQIEVKGKKSRFSWVSSSVRSISSRASDLKSFAESKYDSLDIKFKPELLFLRLKPYIEKAALMVAIAAANEALSDEEKMESIYFWILKLVPSPIRLFMPEKLIFKALWSFRGDLVSKVDDYKQKIESSLSKQEQIEALENEADAAIARAEPLQLHSDAAVLAIDLETEPVPAEQPPPRVETHS
jgi:hypothetical protein